ncbi:MAG: response regulator, partial [Prevotellaceae bacterium]|nr:response regulator [Prevotellaceae bacterium]
MTAKTYLYMASSLPMTSILYVVVAVIFLFLIILYVRHRISAFDLTTKMRFFTRMAHEIRTPVSLIKAPLSEIETQENLSENGKRLLSLALENADKLWVLVSQLPDIRKVDTHAGELFLSKQDIYNCRQEETQLPASRKAVLLLVESHDDMRKYLTESLSSTYHVVSAVDGTKVVALTKEINPDIIIADVLIPGLRGDEICRLLKSSIETSHIPFILLSALSDKEHIIMGL